MKARRTTRLQVAERTLHHSQDIVRDRSEGICEFCGSRLATQQHHRIPRGMGGSSRSLLVNRCANLVDLCLDCHAETERFRVLARNVGLLLGRYLNPATVPLCRRGQWVLLDNDGGFTPCPSPDSEDSAA